MINTIVAESLDFIASDVEKSLGKNPSPEKRDQAVRKVLQGLISKHRTIVFNGDNYADEWQVEAAERGLPNLKTTADALPALQTPKVKTLFKKYKVLSKSELESRSEIFAEKYIAEISIEAEQMAAMARTMILPAAMKHQFTIAQAVGTTEDAGVDSSALRNQLERFVEMVSVFTDRLESLEAIRIPAEGKAIKQCEYCRDRIVPAMEALREIGDQLEANVESELWPMPVYSQLMTLR